MSTTVSLSLVAPPHSGHKPPAGSPGAAKREVTVWFVMSYMHTVE